MKCLLSVVLLSSCAAVVAAQGDSLCPGKLPTGCVEGGATVWSEGSLEEGISGRASEGWLWAWTGREPQASVLWETGAVLPTAAEVRRLPVLERVRRQRALKLVLLERALRARAERHRVSEANLAACAELATREGAPREATAWLRELAAGDVTPRRRYVLNGALASLAELYAVDELSIRYFVEACGLEAGELRKLLPWLPLESLFQLTPMEVLPPTYRMSDGRLSREMLSEWEKGLRGVHDRESADAAAEALRPLLLLQETVMRSRLAEQSGQSKQPGQTTVRVGQDMGRSWERSMRQSLSGERQRLREARFFGSSRLQALDYLLSL